MPACSVKAGILHLGMPWAKVAAGSTGKETTGIAGRHAMCAYGLIKTQWQSAFYSGRKKMKFPDPGRCQNRAICPDLSRSSLESCSIPSCLSGTNSGILLHKGMCGYSSAYVAPEWIFCLMQANMNCMRSVCHERGRKI